MDEHYYTREEHNAYAQRIAQEYFPRNEQQEYARRMDDEHDRQNARIGVLEESIKQYGELAISVSRLADSVEHLCERQESHHKRIKSLEAQDGEMWRKISSHIITTVVGALVAFVLCRLGL